jgi:hypothetical protein
VRNVISIVIDGSSDGFNFDALAERLHRCCRGEPLPDIRNTEGAEFKSCDGVNIKDWICIGKSS